jgi:hypothetical protein
MSRMPFDTPDPVIVDPDSGYAINYPLCKQADPVFWALPEGQVIYQRILQLRTQEGIVVPNDGIDPDPDPTPLKVHPVYVEKARLARQQRRGSKP